MQLRRIILQRLITMQRPNYEQQKNIWIILSPFSEHGPQFMNMGMGELPWTSTSIANGKI